MVARRLCETGDDVKRGDLITPGSVVDDSHSHVGWYYTWAFEMNAAGTFFTVRRSMDKFHVGEVGLLIQIVADAGEKYACVVTPRGIPGYISTQIVKRVE